MWLSGRLNIEKEENPEAMETWVLPQIDETQIVKYVPDKSRPRDMELAKALKATGECTCKDEDIVFTGRWNDAVCGAACWCSKCRVRL